jgi:hypothetical protein
MVSPAREAVNRLPMSGTSAKSSTGVARTQRRVTRGTRAASCCSTRSITAARPIATQIPQSANDAMKK